MPYVLQQKFISYLLIISPQDLRAPSADRRETLARDRYLGALCHASPKFGGFWNQTSISNGFRDI